MKYLILLLFLTSCGAYNENRTIKWIAASKKTITVSAYGFDSNGMRAYYLISNDSIRFDTGFVDIILNNNFIQ